MQIIAYTGPLHIDFGQLYDYTILCMHRPPIETRNKSNDFFESMQYRQDVRHKTRENTSLPVHVVQKITIILAQKIGKSAVRNLILCSGAIWRRREKFEHRCTTTYHPLYNAPKRFFKIARLNWLSVRTNVGPTVRFWHYRYNLTVLLWHPVTR